MATGKFNVGDIVKRITCDNNWRDGRKLKVGTVCEVVKITRYNIDVKVGNTVYDNNNPDYFELVTKEPKFKIGDRVYATDNCEFNRNKLGTIVGLWYDMSHPTPYEVKFDHDGRLLWSKIDSLANDEKIVITHDGKTTTATKYCADGSKVIATARCAPEDTFDFNIGAEIAMGRLVDKLAYAKHYVVRVQFREGERYYSYKTRMDTAKVGMKIVVPVGQNGKEVNATVMEIIPGAEYNGDYAMSAMKEIDIVEVKYWNGKVVVIDAGNVPEDFTIGKIYTFVDGLCENERGTQITNSPVTSFKDLTSRFCSVKFIKIVE